MPGRQPAGPSAVDDHRGVGTKPPRPEDLSTLGWGQRAPELVLVEAGDLGPVDVGGAGHVAGGVGLGAAGIEDLGSFEGIGDDLGPGG